MNNFCADCGRCLINQTCVCKIHTVEIPTCFYCMEEMKFIRQEEIPWEPGTTLPVWECDKKMCRDQESYDFDMGKAIAKGEL